MNQPAATLQIFKAGTHVAEDGRTLTFSEADVQQIADSYDPALHEAPIVVGHPKTDDPAYGWSKVLQAKDGLLMAEPHEVDPAFAELVNNGRFKKISASIFMPDSPGNPTPGKYYLRHIGFLGAQPPAVKGLKSASFAEGDDAACFAMSLAPLGWTLTDLFRRFRDWLIDTQGLETADQVIPDWQIRGIESSTRDDDNSRASALFASPLLTQFPRSALGAPAPVQATPPTREQVKSEIDPMSQQNNAEHAQRQQQLDQQASTLDAREKALAAREQAARREDAVAFAEGLVKEGKLLPRQQPAVVELLLAQPNGKEPLNFAEGETTVTKPAESVLRELLTRLPKAVDFSEKSAGDAPNAAANFAAPAGVHVDAGRADLFNKAKAYQQQHPGTSWAAAVAAVGG
ncbi:TPA: hypothetical protein ACOEQY_002539 [Stenotrophomonas maltophilia]